MDIIVEFRDRKSPGVEYNWVKFAIGSHDGKDSGECVVRGLSLDCNLSVWNPRGKDWSCSESLFKCFKGVMALIGEMPGGTLVLRVSALHSLAGDQVSEGFLTVASAHALHQPTIVGLSISIINVHKFRT